MTTTPRAASASGRKATSDERDTLDAIAVAAYAGGTDRKPEDDVRWLLWLVGELTGGAA